MNSERAEALGWMGMTGRWFDKVCIEKDRHEESSDTTKHKNQTSLSADAVHPRQQLLRQS